MSDGTLPVTQEDREAAIKALNEAERQRSFGGNGTVLSNVCQIIAAHRIAADIAGYERGQRETVERIVAWLRKCQKAKLNHHAEVCHREDDDVLDAIVTAMNTFAYAADAIEAGEWK